MPLLASRPRLGWSSGSLEGLQCPPAAARCGPVSLRRHSDGPAGLLPQGSNLKSLAGWPLASPELGRRHLASGQWPSGFPAPAGRARRPGQPGVPARILVPCASGTQGARRATQAGAGTVQHCSVPVMESPQHQPERQPEHRGAQLGSSNHPALGSHRRQGPA